MHDDIFPTANEILGSLSGPRSVLHGSCTDERTKEGLHFSYAPESDRRGAAWQCTLLALRPSLLNQSYPESYPPKVPIISLRGLLARVREKCRKEKFRV